MAFSNAGLGVVHAMSHQIGSFQPVPHGQACAIALPWVLEYNKEAIGEKIFPIAHALGIRNTEAMMQQQCADAVIAKIRQMCEALDFPATMRDVGIHYGDLEEMAKLASQDLPGTFNPRPASEQDFLELFKKAF